jgi:hypothetical protein
MTRVLKASELVEERGRGLSYIGFRLRRLVWADTEVRDVLLVAADDRAVWDELVGLLAARGASGFSLLDLVTAVSLKPGWSSGGVGRRERAGANDGDIGNTTQPFCARCVVGVSGAAAEWRRTVCRARRIGDPTFQTLVHSEPGTL